MKCADVTERLSVYLDGSVCGDELRALWSHLAKCDSCRERLEVLEIEHSRVSQALSEPVESPDIADLVMARIPAHGKPTARRWVWAYAAVAVCIAVALALYFLPGNRTGQQVVQEKRITAPSLPATPPVPVPAPEQAVQPPKLVEETSSAGLQHHPRRRTVVKQPSRTVLSPTAPPIREVSDGNPSVIAAEPKEIISSEPSLHIVVERDSVSPGGWNARIEVAVLMDGNAAGRLAPAVHALPPNEDAETIERPALQLVENRGPERLVIQTPGG